VQEVVGAWGGTLSRTYPPYTSPQGLRPVQAAKLKRITAPCPKGKLGGVAFGPGWPEETQQCLLN